MPPMPPMPPTPPSPRSFSQAASVAFDKERHIGSPSEADYGVVKSIISVSDFVYIMPELGAYILCRSWEMGPRRRTSRKSKRPRISFFLLQGNAEITKRDPFELQTFEALRGIR